MLKRKITEKLERWKNSHDNKAFLLYGARQTGKSYIINDFCLKNFDTYLFIDFINNQEAKNIINNCSNLVDYQRALSAIFKEKFNKDNTVIFFDECQEVPELITMIKYIVQSSKHKFILSGSLLGLTFRNIKSIPIGYVELYKLYPLDFEEYLWANNVSLSLILEAKECFKRNQVIPEVIHNQFMKYFREYLIVGGMPNCVKTFLETNNYETLYIEQSFINSLNELDFSKYETENKKLRLTKLYRYIPSRLNTEYTRFNLSEFDSKVRYETIVDSIDWLITAGVSIEVPLVNNLTAGVFLYNDHLFKLYLSDVGLLMNMLGSSVRNKILGNDINFNYGFIYENYVAEELLTNGFNPYYFNQRKHGEIEFIVESKEYGCILPIEVKSGKDYKEHKSLDYVLNTYQDISLSYVFCNENISISGKVIYAPIYCVNFLKNE
jgi:predicted AAA+ superfamily ATPase